MTSHDSPALLVIAAMLLAPVLVGCSTTDDKGVFRQMMADVCDCGAVLYECYADTDDTSACNDDRYVCHEDAFAAADETAPEGGCTKTYLECYRLAVDPDGFDACEDALTECADWYDAPCVDACSSNAAACYDETGGEYKSSLACADEQCACMDECF